MHLELCFRQKGINLFGGNFVKVSNLRQVSDTEIIAQKKMLTLIANIIFLQYVFPTESLYHSILLGEF